MIYCKSFGVNKKRFNTLDYMSCSKYMGPKSQKKRSLVVFASLCIYCCRNVTKRLYTDWFIHMQTFLESIWNILWKQTDFFKGAIIRKKSVCLNNWNRLQRLIGPYTSSDLCETFRRLTSGAQRNEWKDEELLTRSKNFQILNKLLVQELFYCQKLWNSDLHKICIV